MPKIYAGPNINAVPVITGKLVDSGNGVRVGTNVICIGRVFSSANAATTFNHQLGRIPTTIRHGLTRAGGVVYATTSDMASWTVSTVVLRCTTADTADFELL